MSCKGRAEVPVVVLAGFRVVSVLFVTRLGIPVLVQDRAWETGSPVLRPGWGRLPPLPGDEWSGVPPPHFPLPPFHSPRKGGTSEHGTPHPRR